MKAKSLALIVFGIGIGVIAVVAINLFSPVTISLGQGTESPNYSSTAFVQDALTARMKIIGDTEVKSIICENNECDVETVKKDLPEGVYVAKLEVRNMVGMLMATETVDIVVDQTPPEMLLTYPKLTNQQQVEIKVETELGAQVFVDDEPLGQFTTKGISYSAQLNTEGDNIYQFKSVDSAGNETKEFAKINLDQEVALNITSPKSGATVPEKFVVKGKTDPGARVEVNGAKVKASKDGSFQVTVNYKDKGLVVISTDAAGNTVSKAVSLKKKPSTPVAEVKQLTCTKYSDVAKALESSDQVRVIGIALNLEARDGLLESLHPAEFSPAHKYATMPYFSGTITKNGFEKICRDDRLKGMTIDQVLETN